MWRNPSLARPGVWFCLLGSVLALVAFFLPSVTYAPGSLEDCLTSCDLDRIFPSYSSQVEPVPWGVGALLLLLLGVAVWAFLMLFLRSHREKSLLIYLRLTTLTLMYYLGTALITLFSAWVGEEIASPTGVDFTDVFSWVGIGAWLILAGLLLALIGAILLKRRENKAAS